MGLHTHWVKELLQMAFQYLIRYLYSMISQSRTILSIFLFLICVGCAEDKPLIFGEINEVSCYGTKTLGMVVLNISTSAGEESMGFTLEDRYGCKRAVDFFLEYDAIEIRLLNNVPYQVILDGNVVFKGEAGKRLLFTGEGLEEE